MIIHIWMHWFWITFFSSMGLLSRLSLCSTEAGLPGTSPPYVVVPLNASGNASQDVESRLRRGEEEEGAGVTTTLVVVDETESSDDAYHGAVASDVEDTYNGGHLDGFHYPLKKYIKKFGKPKAKTKSDEEVTERAGNEAQIEPNATAETEVTAAPNETVEASAEDGNQTAIAEVSQTENATKEDELNPETDPTNSTNDDQSYAESAQTEINLTAENKLEERVARTTVEPFFFNNRVAAATSSENRERLSQPSLDAESITGITLGIVAISGVIGAVSFVLYRRRYLNKPQALNDKSSNLDSSGYIDDTSLRENSEEMYSLDNDSFLNSLEAMTIQNYWTENVKHTKL